MKIRKRLATPSGDLPLVYEDVRLELSAPGRAVVQVVSKEPVSGFVAFAMGYAVNGRDALVFAGYVERCTTMDGSQQRLMCREIAAKLEALTGQQTRVTVPGHYQRGGPPCPYDRVLATQFGAAAAELIINKQYGRMVAIQGGNICSIPLEEAASRTKFLPVDHPLIKVARDIGISFGD